LSAPTHACSSLISISYACSPYILFGTQRQVHVNVVCVFSPRACVFKYWNAALMPVNKFAQPLHKSVPHKPCGLNHPVCSMLEQSHNSLNIGLSAGAPKLSCDTSTHIQICMCAHTGIRTPAPPCPPGCLLHVHNIHLPQCTQTYTHTHTAIQHTSKNCTHTTPQHSTHTCASLSSWVRAVASCRTAAARASSATRTECEHMSVCVCTRVGSCVSMCYMSVCVLRVHVYVCASVLLRVIPLLFMCAYAPNLNCAYICVRVHVWIKHLPEVCRRSRCSCLAASSCSSFEHTCITNIFHRSRVE
jgi:hypothetical protein